MGNSWSDLNGAIEKWKDSRINKAKSKLKEDAETLRSNILSALQGAGDKTTDQSKALTAKTNVSPEAKQAQLAPSGVNEKNKTSPREGLDTYANSIIIEDESSGLKTIQVVKINEPSKKDETTGMSLVKIAKAIEFGTTKSAPQPAWRRSLNKLRATGVYRKTFGQ